MIRTRVSRWLTTLTVVFCALLVLPGVAAEQAKPDAAEALTTADPHVALDQLPLMLRPLSRDQLLVEADDWRALLQDKVQEIVDLELEIKRTGDAAKQAEDVRDLALELKAKNQELVEAQQAAAAGTEGADEQVQQAAEAAEALFEELREKAAQTPAAMILAAFDAASGGKAQLDKDVALQRIADDSQAQADVIHEKKVAMSESLPPLQTERASLIDRLNAVLEDIELKTDPADAETLAVVQDHRLYTKAISGLRVNVDDTQSAFITIKGWLMSEEGGLRWLINFAKFVGILVAAAIISRMLSAATRHALSHAEGTSRLLEDFLTKFVRWVVMAIGIIMALSALEVSVGPLLAVLGAAGFVVAFALQDSLSNFASGLMILFFQPFDEGDVIDAGGVSGRVQSVNLVSTTIVTFDNKRMIVPNNKIWNDVITNVTGVTERRVDMTFGIGYDDDIAQAQAIMEEIIGNHPKVLETPEPVVRMHELADSSVNFVARPWAKTDDYWDVFWDVTKAVKQRFDAEGIGIPFPQRDVHLHIAGGDGDAANSLRAAPPVAAAGAAVVGTAAQADGGLDDGDDDDNGGSA